MVILGIDPGLATVGFGVINKINGSLKCLDYGAIKTASDLDLSERLYIIRKDFLCLLDEFKPDLIGIEKLFFVKNVTNGMKVAHARGVILEPLYKMNIPILHFTPLEVKNNITGDGGAKKWQVQEMVKRLLNLQKIPKPDDAADALAIALCSERVHTNQLYLKV